MVVYFFPMSFLACHVVNLVRAVACSQISHSVDAAHAAHAAQALRMENITIIKMPCKEKNSLVIILCIHYN